MHNGQLQNVVKNHFLITSESVYAIWVVDHHQISVYRETIVWSPPICSTDGEHLYVFIFIFVILVIIYSTYILYM
jgi:hypothetical protein